MDMFTRNQWIVLGSSAAIGFVALYFWLDYGFWTSLVIEVGLVAVTIWAQKRKLSTATQR